MATVKSVTTIKTVITRMWWDVEPKVLTFAATGLTASGVAAVAQFFGFAFPAGLSVLIATTVASIAAYIKKSTLKTDVPAVQAIATSPAVTSGAVKVEVAPDPASPSSVSSVDPASQTPAYRDQIPPEFRQ